MADGRTWKWSRKNTFPYSGWDVPGREGTESRCVRHEVSQTKGSRIAARIRGVGVEGQCLGPRFALTTVHIQRMLLLDQTVLHPWGHLGLVMLRRDEKPQDF